MIARTNLLNLLASVPPEMLVEGTQIEVTTVAGETFTITLGERIPPPERFAFGKEAK